MDGQKQRNIIFDNFLIVAVHTFYVQMTIMDTSDEQPFKEDNHNERIEL